MASARKFLETVIDLQEILDYIENSDKKTGQLIYDLQDDLGYSRKALENRFGAVYVSKDGEEETISKYINRRKSNCEEEYTLNNIRYVSCLLSIIEGYKFCKIDVDKDKLALLGDKSNFYNTIMSEINLKKKLYSTLTNDIYIYFDSGDKIINGTDIFDFNMDYLNTSNYNKRKINEKRLEFYGFYINEKGNDVITINNLLYYINNRQWLIDNLQDYVSINIPDDLSKYKTILYKTKDTLRVIKDINNGTIDSKHKNVINNDKFNLKIKTEQDVQINYNKSVEEIMNKMHEYERVVFNMILEIEEGKIDKGNIKGESYHIYISTLYSLLIKGIVHMA